MAGRAPRRNRARRPLPARPRVYAQELPGGTVYCWDRQSDIYAGEYRIVGFDPATGLYTAERLAPNDRIIAEIQRDVESGAYWVPPDADRRAEAEKEIQQRIDEAGTQFAFRPMSAAAFDAMF